jgi:hypothetical protein
MVWKHKLSKEIHMAAGDVYGPIQGFVAFDPEERELPSEAIIRTFSVNSFETGELVRCTLWPEYADLGVRKGDLVIGEGKITRRDGEKNGSKVTYTNISLNRVVVIPGFEPAETEVAEPAPRRRRSSS